MGGLSDGSPSSFRLLRLGEEAQGGVVVALAAPAVEEAIDMPPTPIDDS